MKPFDVDIRQTRAVGITLDFLGKPTEISRYAATNAPVMH
jgi:hypothetical protein